MAITKPPVKNIWADAGDKVEPSGAEVTTGWPLSNVPPARQRFNWILNFLSNAVRYFSRRGLVDWDSAENYEINDRVQGPDGFTYRSKTANNNKTPSANPNDWELWAFTETQLGTKLNSSAIKNPVRIASTANIAALSGLANIDGVTPIAGDRILVKDQTTGSQNGIYVAAAGAWSRSTDADQTGEIVSGMVITVSEGTVNADTLWILTTNGTITIGTTSLVFAQFNSGITQAAADARYLGIGYMLVRDEKPSGTGAGTPSAGQNTRTLNTVSTNSIAGASLSSNDITLPAGTYRIEGRAIAGSTASAQLNLYNVTTSSIIAVGFAANTYATNSGDLVEVEQTVSTKVTFATTTTIRLRQYIENSNTGGFGVGANSGLTQVYAQVEIIKES